MSTCPRCRNDYDARYPAASRAIPERDIDICGPCGSDEAIGRGPIRMADWPVR